MSAEEYSLIAIADTTSIYVEQVPVDKTKHAVLSSRKRQNTIPRQNSLLRRLSSFQLNLNFTKFRKSVRKLSCINKEEEEEEYVDVHRHKSIDIGVGMVRRVSLFLFTRKSVCSHPYHPFTPKQSSRKINIFDDHRS